MKLSDGINQYMDEGVTQSSFLWLAKKEKFTIKDVYNIFGYMSLVSPWHKKTDPLLTDIRNKYGMDYPKDFNLDGNLIYGIIKTQKKVQEFLAISKSVAALLIFHPPFVGHGYRTKENKMESFCK
jgi:penicillin amidase